VSVSRDADPPSVETVPASGELEINLGETADMQCVAKGVPAPVISWMTKVIDIPGTVYADDIKLFARQSAVGMFDKKRAGGKGRAGEKCNTTRMSVCGIPRVAQAFDRTISQFN